MYYGECKRNLFLSITVFFFLFYLSNFSFSQSGEKTGSLFILRGNTILSTGKSVEGVDLELKKDGKIISKTISGKNGKYYIQMEASTTNSKNEYILHITQAGTIPKSLSINTYVPPGEFKLNHYALKVHRF